MRKGAEEGRGTMGDQVGSRGGRVEGRKKEGEEERRGGRREGGAHNTETERVPSRVVQAARLPCGPGSGLPRHPLS